MKPFGIAFVLAVALVGCSQKSPVGKWDANISAQGRQYPALVDIKADGTMTSEISIPFPTGDIKVIVVGTWKSDGKSFTAKTTDIQAPADASEMLKASLQMIKPQIMNQLGQDRTATIAFKDSGSMEMTTVDGAVTTYVPHKS